MTHDDPMGPVEDISSLQSDGAQGGGGDSQAYIDAVSPAPTLFEALDELRAAYEEGEPDRCAEAIQPVLDAHARLSLDWPRPRLAE